jgi:endonuclease/exonuclease/phosphatase family metal-dependent hydrolase
MASSSRARARVFLPLVLVTACGPELGPASDWIPVDQVTGVLAATHSLSPAMSKPLAGQRAAGFLRVVSYNVEFGEEVDALATLLRDDPELSQAGVVLLQESEDHPGEGAPRAQQVAEQLGWAWVYVPARVKADYTHGLAILSPHPIDQVDEMLLPRTDTGHQRIAVRANVHVGDVTVQVINVHLETILNPNERLQQLRPAVIDPPDLVVVAGDLNTNPYLWNDVKVPVLPASTVADVDQAAIVDDFMRHAGYATPTADLGHTEEMYGVASRLDAIYLRGAASGGAAVRRDVRLSDHFPLWVDVELPR